MQDADDDDAAAAAAAATMRRQQTPRVTRLGILLGRTNETFPNLASSWPISPRLGQPSSHDHHHWRGCGVFKTD